MEVADLLDQLDGRTAERIDRPFDLRQAEARRRHGGADVGRQHQLEAAANAVAVHRGDDRLRVGSFLSNAWLTIRATSGPADRSPLTSAPTVKARSPAPVSTMHRHSSR